MTNEEGANLMNPVVRWALVLPATAGAMWASWQLFSLLDDFHSYVSNQPRDDLISAVLLTIGTNGVSSALGVAAGAAAAPMFRPRVGVALAAGSAVFGLFAAVYAMRGESGVWVWKQLLGAASWVIGGVLGALWVVAKGARSRSEPSGEPLDAGELLGKPPQGPRE